MAYRPILKPERGDWDLEITRADFDKILALNSRVAGEDDPTILTSTPDWSGAGVIIMIVAGEDGEQIRAEYKVLPDNNDNVLINCIWWEGDITTFTIVGSADEVKAALILTINSLANINIPNPWAAMMEAKTVR